MHVKIMTFRYSAALGGFDDSALADFTRDKEMLSFREHLFLVNDVPHLACVMSYQTTTPPPAAQEARASRGRERPDLGAALAGPERELLDRLRSWRSQAAREEGVPAFVVLTNRELLAIVQARPSSRAALGQVQGIGPKKIERHGSAILTIVQDASAPDTDVEE